MVLGNRGTKANFLGEQGNKSLKIRGTQAILGEQGTYKIKILFLGNKAIFSRGTREHVPIPTPGGPHYTSDGVCRKRTWLSEDDVTVE